MPHEQNRCLMNKIFIVRLYEKISTPRPFEKNVRYEYIEILLFGWFVYFKYYIQKSGYNKIAYGRYVISLLRITIMRNV